MEIKYFGHSSFQIKTTSNAPGAKVTRIVTDPFNPAAVGFKYPKVDADIVTVSHHHKDHDAVSLVGGTPLILDWPGEFEKNNVRVFGFQSFHDKEKGAKRGENVLYKFETENISVLHCGDLGFVPDESFIEDLGEVDILMIPVGGFFTIDSTEAAAVIKKIEPSIVIPMHYLTSGHDGAAYAGVAPVEEFLKKMEIEAREPQDKLTIKSDELIDEEMKVVVLKQNEVGGN